MCKKRKENLKNSTSLLIYDALVEASVKILCKGTTQPTS